jgi:hypothetical protein
MANSHGQLGFRKIDIPSGSASKSRVPIELIPNSVADPYAKASPSIRPNLSSQQPGYEHLAKVDDENITFCDQLFEVPALKNIKVSQIAAGGRSSYARTAAGRVLGWGANEYG